MTWREKDHPRDEKGQFTNGKSGSIVPGEGEIADAFTDFELENSKENAKKIFEFTSRFETIRLPRKEYGYIISQISTNISKEQKRQPIVKMAIANCWYVFENRGFGNYRIIDIISIE